MKFVEPNETKRRERDRERNYITREETRDKEKLWIRKNKRGNVYYRKNQ